MDKRTLLAVVLSVVVLSVFYVIQGKNAPAARQATSAPAAAQSSGAAAPAAVAETVNTQNFSGVSVSELGSDEKEPLEETVTIETNLATIKFTNAGGDIVSYRLKEHREGDKQV